MVTQVQSFNIRTKLKPPKLKVWNKLLTSLSIGASKTSKVIEIKSCLAHSLSMYCICHLVNMKLGSPALKVLLKIADRNFDLGKVVTSSMKILAWRLFSTLGHCFCDLGQGMRTGLTQSRSTSGPCQ